MTIDEFKKNIAPHMRKGWVAMDKNNSWYWYSKKPVQKEDNRWVSNINNTAYLSLGFDIEPVNDWTESLIEVGKCTR